MNMSYRNCNISNHDIQETLEEWTKSTYNPYNKKVSVNICDGIFQGNITISPTDIELKTEPTKEIVLAQNDFYLHFKFNYCSFLYDYNKTSLIFLHNGEEVCTLEVYR